MNQRCPVLCEVIRQCPRHVKETASISINNVPNLRQFYPNFVVNLCQNPITFKNLFNEPS